MVGKDCAVTSLFVAGRTEVVAEVVVENEVVAGSDFTAARAFHEVVGVAMRAVGIAADYRHDTVVIVVVTVVTSGIACVEAGFTDVIAAVVVLMRVDKVGVVRMNGVPTVFTDDHVVDAVRAEVFAVVAE